jgi:hypothetical protein
MVAQMVSLFVGFRSEERMRKMRDEIRAYSLENAKRLDDLQLKADRMKEACGTLRGVVKN